MKRCVLLIAVVVCLSLVAPTFAATYGTANVLESIVDPTTQMNAYFATYFPSGVQAYTSVYYLALSNVVMNPGVPFTVQSGRGFCIEAQYSGGNAPYSIVDVADAPLVNGPGGSPMGAAKAGLVSKLFGGAYSSLSTGTQIAAFQTALWEIVYESDSTLDATTGAFYATGDANVLSQANTWLSNLGSYSDYSGRLVALTNNTQQDYVTVAVPEIPTAMLAPLGLAVVGLVRRRLAR